MKNDRPLKNPHMEHCRHKMLLLLERYDLAGAVCLIDAQEMGFALASAVLASLDRVEEGQTPPPATVFHPTQETVPQINALHAAHGRDEDWIQRYRTKMLRRFQVVTHGQFTPAQLQGMRDEVQQFYATLAVQDVSLTVQDGPLAPETLRRRLLLQMALWGILARTMPRKPQAPQACGARCLPPGCGRWTLRRWHRKRRVCLRMPTPPRRRGRQWSRGCSMPATRRGGGRKRC